MDLSLNYGQSALPGELGTGLYDFSVDESVNLPPAEAAYKASQVESGGSGWGFDLNSALKDLAGAWVASESYQARAASGAPVQYRRGTDGQLYVTDPTYRNGPPGGGGSILGIPVTWLLVGGLIFFAVTAAKD
jgi:hypothetical protein